MIVELCISNNFDYWFNRYYYDLELYVSWLDFLFSANNSVNMIVELCISNIDIRDTAIGLWIYIKCLLIKTNEILTKLLVLLINLFTCSRGDPKEIIQMYNDKKEAYREIRDYVHRCRKFIEVSYQS